MEPNPTKDYFVGVTIGEGRFGRVVHARHKISKKQVAIKVFEKVRLHKESRLMPAIWNERSLLMKFQSCPYIVNLWGAFHDSECLYLVMECLKGGDLQDLIVEGMKMKMKMKTTTDREWWTTHVAPHYALQLVKAVEFLHKHQTLHGDLKPQNVLVTARGRLQLADFGSAVRLGISQKQGPKPQSDTQQQSDQGQNNKDNDTIFGGTVDFASPEILKGTSISKLTISSDLWSLGCIFHALLTGSSPFHAATDALAIQSIMEYANGSEKPSFGPDSDSDSAGTYSYSEGWKELIWGLLHPQPEKRLGATENDSPPIGSLIPCFDSIDLDNDPPFLPPEPKWVVEARCTEMRDGSKGWSSFLL